MAANDLQPQPPPETTLEPENQPLLPSTVRTESNLRTLPVFPLQKGRSKRFESKDGLVIRATRQRRQGGTTLATTWEVRGPLQPSDKETFVAVESFITDEFLSKGREVPEWVKVPSYRQLLRRAGRKHPSQWDNDDLKESFRRIVHTTCTSRGAWTEKRIDPQTQQLTEHWYEGVFGLYDSVWIRGETRPDGTQVVRGVVIALGREYRASLNANHTIPLDYDLWRELKNPVARRLVEILAIKFYGLVQQGGSVLTQDYEYLCDILPVEPQPYLSKARQTLHRAHAELVAARFLAADPEWTWEQGTKSIRYRPGERFHAFNHRMLGLAEQTNLPLTETRPPASPAAVPDDQLVTEFRNRGVTQRSQAQLLADVARRMSDEDRRRHFIEHDHQLKERGSAVENPAGLLSKRFTENWPPSQWYLERQQSQQRKKAAAERDAQESAKRRADEAAIAAERAAFDALTPREKARVSLERWEPIQAQLLGRALRDDEKDAYYKKQLARWQPLETADTEQTSPTV